MNNLFTEYSAYYFFSSWLQADAALISIVAIFIIFKLQTYNSKIDGIKTALFNMSKSVGPSEVTQFDGFSPEKKLKYINKKLESPYSVNEGRIFESWKLTEEKIVKIKQQMKWPIIFLATTMGMCGIALFLSNYIHKSGFIIEFIITVTILILHLIAIMQNLTFIIKSIKE